MAIREDPEFKLAILVTGMHLDPVHGETWREIAGDGFTIAERVPGRVTGDSLSTMAASIGLYLYGMAQALERIRPDVVLVTGDRGEQVAAALAAAVQNMVLVHLAGGSISGSIDDSFRHSITKLAHYHLPAFEEHARRIIQMGEEPSRVRVVGLPGGDIRPDVTYSREQLCRELGLPLERPYLLVVQHSVTHSQPDAERQITETLEAVAASGYPTLLANPNDDAGGRVILATMREYAGRYANLKILAPQLSRERFASILTHAGALVGNSSCSIVEAMSVKLPVVNVGDRQRGREHLTCLLNVDYDRAQIGKAIGDALEDPAYRQRVADFSARTSRDTPAEVVDFLKKVDLTVAARPKQFHDLPASGVDPA
jgi:UDP-N-acetylglucosamine 2-epimerase (non-hydrolysing)/GDP/UDP-N,N'-diacetylbacillosamine 2-epimerase (hydrolysing)